MISTDFKIAFRNIRRNKVTSTISILGLGIGFGRIILLMALIVHEDFLRWVIISVIVAIPEAIYIMISWQKRFVYKTDLSWWIFGVAGISAILIAILTVSWNSWRAATRNPVEALRYE